MKKLTSLFSTFAFAFILTLPAFNLIHAMKSNSHVEIEQTEKEKFCEIFSKFSYDENQPLDISNHYRWDLYVQIAELAKFDNPAFAIDLLHSYNVPWQKLNIFPMATQNFDMKILNLLLLAAEKNAKDVLLTQDPEGNTPLHIATQGALFSKNIVLLFLNVMGGDEWKILFIKNNQGKTAFDLAKEWATNGISENDTSSFAQLIKIFENAEKKYLKKDFITCIEIPQ